ncbi:MAG: DUF4139 domain-containing protein [Deltaproteobacteria bacterium]|nr:DUF4139 domain-containing protein [Deltaproteobacteria bacterium]
MTVFRSGARVRRVARVTSSGEAWPSELVVPDLPLAIDDGSVRARFGGSLIATSIRVVLDAPSVTGPRSIEAEESARDEAKRQEALIRGRIGSIDAELELLGSISLDRRPLPKPGEAPNASPTISRLALLDALAPELARRRAERARALEELKEVEERRRTAEARIREASSGVAPKPEELRKAVIIGVRTAGQETSAELQLEYLVPGARWMPAYSFHFDAAMERAHLGVRAVVAQQSGEDWSGVGLRLSTAESQAWMELPELSSLRIGRRQARVDKRGWRALPPGVDELFRGYDEFASGTPRRSKTDARELPLGRSTQVDELEDFEDVATPAPELDATDSWAMANSTPSESHLAEEDGDWGDDDESAPPAEMAKKRAGGPAKEMASMDVPFGAMAPPAMAPPAPMLSAPMPKQAARMSLGRVITERRRAEGGGGGPGAPSMMLLDEPERSPVPSHLDYDALRLPAATDGRRGGLIAVERLELYAELLVSAKIELTYELFAAVETARRQAIEPSRASPPRFVPPRDFDGFDYAYLTEGPADVPSDGTFHAIAVMAREAECGVRYVTVPRETQDVFRFATLKNPLEAPLLPGPADVYVGGTYLMTSSIDPTPPRGGVELGLGVEQSIKVARNTSFLEETAGLMRGSLSLKHEIKIELVNLLTRPAEIEVRERIPVTREGDEDAKVELVKAEPAIDGYEQGAAPIKGGKRWRVLLSPGQRRMLSAVYAVKISGKNELVGGNRRES